MSASVTQQPHHNNYDMSELWKSKKRGLDYYTDTVAHKRNLLEPTEKVTLKEDGVISGPQPNYRRGSIVRY
jgi:hypothetical protein